MASLQPTISAPISSSSGLFGGPPLPPPNNNNNNNTADSSVALAIPVGNASTTADDTEEGLIEDETPQQDPQRWFFTKEQLENTPSRKVGLEADKELMYRQQSANFIQDIGQRLQVNQLCINTAIVYMHRFYMFHSFTLFHRNSVSTASVFLAAKVEEQPRKLEYVIKVAHYCLYRDSQPPIDLKSESYANLAAELVMNENILLQTLGFDVAIDHPHTHVVKCCQLVRASKDLAQTSYFMATNSLHLTTMCLEYRSSVVACVCIHLACKWSNWEIPRSKEGKDWFWYVDGNVTIEQLEQYTTEFLTIFNKSPSRLKKKIISLSAATRGNSGSLNSFPSHFNLDPSSPGMPQFSKSRSPSPSDLSNSGKLRLPQVKPGGAHPLFPMRPTVKPAPGTHHGVSKPHPVSSSSHSTNVAAIPPHHRPSQGHSSAHPVPGKPGHHHPPLPHSMGTHAVSKEHQKPQPYPPHGYHPPSGSSMPGHSQNSHAVAGSRPQPQPSNVNAPVPHSAVHPPLQKPGLPPGVKPSGPPMPNWKPPFAVQPGAQTQPSKPHHLTSAIKPAMIAPNHGQLKPGAPPHQSQPPLQPTQHPLKRPYPSDMPRLEYRGEPPIKREPTAVPRQPTNHLSSTQPRAQLPQPIGMVRPKLEKQELRQNTPSAPTPNYHVNVSSQSQNHGVGLSQSLPPAADGRPWMDRFLDNEIQITQSQPVNKPVTVKTEVKPQLQVTSSGLPARTPASVSTASFQVSSTSSTVTAGMATSSFPTPAPAPSIAPSATNALPLLTAATFPSSSSLLLNNESGDAKKKKDKKHKKDKHKDKDEKEHKHKHKEEKKHKKDKHKEKHKSKEKRRLSEDFTIDSANSANKLKIIIGRNPNTAQEPKDPKSKPKDHHTATIVNY